MRYCPACHSVFPNEFRTCPKDQAELRTASELQPGMVLRGKYEILEKIGAGGMASVYRARHLAFNEVCAIKVVAARLSDDEDFLRRFRNEAVVARRFQHPHAVRVDDLDTTEDGRPFIVMEFVEGPNLREVVRREGALGLRRALTIARQVASALAAAHHLGIVHRDIKPDNVLLTSTGPDAAAKVLDFGIAKVKEGFFGGGEQIATRTGAVVGTPQYISPEQALGRRGDELDGRADLYSLGVVLYEMVTGRLPFESDTAMGIILHHLQTLPTPPHDVRPDLDIPPPLSAVLLRMLDKDRERRFRTSDDLITALDEVLALPLPERAASVNPAGADLRPPTPPRAVPADIDQADTRMMPKTPPVSSSRSMAPTPVPLPTVHIPLPIPGTPLPRTPAPPPLPVTGGRPAKKRPRVFSFLQFWAGLAIALYFVFGRGDSKRPRRAATASPAAAVAGENSPERDDRIEEAVEAALEDSPVTTDESISVAVDRGVVTLYGHVHARKPAEEADRLARGVPGVTAVSNEIQLRARDDHRASVPRAEAVLALPPPDGVAGAGPVPAVPGLPALDSALQKMTRDLPLRSLLRAGQRELARGRPEEAMHAFSAALSLDPGNPEAAAGLAAAGRMLSEQDRRQRSSPPAPPAPRAMPRPPDGER